jgi:hypothetical protein
LKILVEGPDARPGLCKQRGAHRRRAAKNCEEAARLLSRKKRIETWVSVLIACWKIEFKLFEL